MPSVSKVAVHGFDSLFVQKLCQVSVHFVLTIVNIAMRAYSAYAALILLVLPNLQHLQIADFWYVVLDHLHQVLRNLEPEAEGNRRCPSQALLDRLWSIKRVSLNVDRLSGLIYPTELKHGDIDHVLNLPGITKLELSIPIGQGRGLSELQPNHPSFLSHQLITSIRPTNITTLIIRHSGPLLHVLHSLLRCTPQLRSLTYELFRNGGRPEPRIIDLAAWSDSLQKIKATLEILVFSVELCDTDLYYFQQPTVSSEDQLHGYLDLTNLIQLHTLEVPVPFLTGDVEMSITTEIYPLLPPNLRHLSLRTDLSHAQFLFPFDTSILPQTLTLQESKLEARHQMNARMDMSYMFHATLALLDRASGLETMSVWHPTDPSLCWFDSQVADFTTACENKSVTGKIIHPMLLRWRKPENWNLIKEITVFDRAVPRQGPVEKLYREEWGDMPIGLASQYHLHVLRSHQVLRG